MLLGICVSEDDITVLTWSQGASNCSAVNVSSVNEHEHNVTTQKQQRNRASDLTHRLSLGFYPLNQELIFSSV